jgi:hypothetical protein
VYLLNLPESAILGGDDNGSCVIFNRARTLFCPRKKVWYFVLVSQKRETNNPNKNVRVAVKGVDFNFNKNVKVQDES